MTVRFSIITTCKGRLEHLKASLPAMLNQADSEVIVVDYSCPDETAAYVGEHFPAARTVSVVGEKDFSNWKARNAGAAIAKGRFLVFCDADILLAADATKKLAQRLTPASFGYFHNDASEEAAPGKTAMAVNQLKGFQIVARESFQKVGGYDELLSGYAAGGDTELEERLRFLQLDMVPLGRDIIERVISHDDSTRMRFHKDPALQSYLVGYLYRWIKIALMGIRKGTELEPSTKTDLHDLARRGASSFLAENKLTAIKLAVVNEPLKMFQIDGKPAPRLKVTINVEIVPDRRSAPE